MTSLPTRSVHRWRRQTLPRQTAYAPVLALLLAFVATACGSSDADSKDGSQTQKFTAPSGDVLKLDKTPKRIVCLTGLCDDVLFTLGITPVGTSTPGLLKLDEYLGDKADDITTIPGGFGSEDLESVAALDPDLVIGLAGVHDQSREAIEQFAPLLVVDVAGYEDSLKYQTFLGEVTDRKDEAKAGNKEFEETLSSAKKRAAEAGLTDTTALSMYWNVGTTGVNTSDDILGSMFSQLFDYPWKNKGGDPTEQAAYSVEEILKADPKIIFMQSYTASADAPKASEELAGNPVWSRISAVKDDKVMEVEVDLWTAGRGPKALGLVVQQAIDFALN